MYRKIVFVSVVLLIAFLAFGCVDKEKEKLNADNSSLALKVDQQTEVINRMSGEVFNKNASLQAFQKANDSLSNAFSKTQSQLANANAVNWKQKAAIDSLKALADSLPCIEQLYADSSHELQLTRRELSDAKTAIGMMTKELEAKASLLDSVRQCYDVQKHNAGRSWWNKTFGGNFWGLPFPEPAFLATPAITANPVVKPEPEKKKSRRNR